MHFPYFDWKNEVRVIKQSLAVFLSLTCGLAIGLVFLLCNLKLELIIIILLFINIILFLYLKYVGVKLCIYLVKLIDSRTCYLKLIWV